MTVHPVTELVAAAAFRHTFIAGAEPDWKATVDLWAATPEHTKAGWCAVAEAIVAELGQTGLTITD